MEHLGRGDRKVDTKENKTTFANTKEKGVETHPLKEETRKEVEVCSWDCDFAFDCETTVLIKKLNVFLDWKVIRDSLDKAPFLQSSFKVFFCKLSSRVLQF